MSGRDKAGVVTIASLLGEYLRAVRMIDPATTMLVVTILTGSVV